jgi:hypothetical protein
LVNPIWQKVFFLHPPSLSYLTERMRQRFWFGLSAAAFTQPGASTSKRIFKAATVAHFLPPPDPREYFFFQNQPWSPRVILNFT